MKFKVIQPPADSVINATNAMFHLRIETVEDTPYIESLIAAATSHAEELMECSLISRTIEATFFAGERMFLPRGPVQDILSVSVDGKVQDPGTYSIESYGNNDLLRFNNSTVQPFAAPTTLVCTYKAGFGGPDDVPPDVVQVIRCHVGLLYEQRELATDRTITPIPFIAEFYKLRGRGTGVG